MVTPATKTGSRKGRWDKFGKVSLGWNIPQLLKGESTYFVLEFGKDVHLKAILRWDPHTDKWRLAIHEDKKASPFLTVIVFTDLTGKNYQRALDEASTLIVDWMLYEME